MSSSNSIINKELRKHVSPVLREAGFDRVDARNGWAFRQRHIRVFNIRAVGRTFSEVTGWPPSSLTVWLGVYFPFIPEPPAESLKHDANGEPRPAEHHCHMRTHLERRIRQASLLRSLPNRAERKRRDVWWISPGGEEADDVAADIASVLLKRGLPWFDQASDLKSALREIERERDCLQKFFRAHHVARTLGDEERAEKFALLEAVERERIE